MKYIIKRPNMPEEESYLMFSGDNVTVWCGIDRALRFGTIEDALFEKRENEIILADDSGTEV